MSENARVCGCQNSNKNQLALIVIDEAHMIYSWGLVASGKAKKSSAHKKTKDCSIFRPSFGNMSDQLSATEGVPILFLSATCRPVTIHGILKFLKITEDNINFIQGELTRPKIQILRVIMTSSLKSNQDLLPVIEKPKSSNDQIEPTLIYSRTQKATLQAMKVANKARHTPGAKYNSHSSLIQRYHSNTGDVAKIDSIDAFTGKKFPYMLCTMALGLGQNWKQVHKVIHMGRRDPSNICQMMGCCGRDGRPGLALLFMEKKQRQGKNLIEDFAGLKEQSNDDYMDTLVVTLICLRIAFSLDNLHGYIPMSTKDDQYLEEGQRKIDEEFPPCQCSNCLPEEAIQLYNNMRKLTVQNFSDAILNPQLLPTTSYVPFDQPSRKRGPQRKELSPALLEFSSSLVKEFENFFSGNSTRNQHLSSQIKYLV
ncbi:hypothetical protein PTTG_27534 [Puccinia triticina 1-1 BBBD Race 1]|uniref:DNA 3'-5' helicase n=1 Tax=Puccinia triticina (isolate 1-1 / race 1 (BBBD)) TaxID=630390 RepID=A0A180GJ93_PUCT1|nr:hypothetical protein PTTG_27534 [Puccinia triticina 1-1 BBBD Race 1]